MLLNVGFSINKGTSHQLDNILGENEGVHLKMSQIYMQNNKLPKRPPKRSCQRWLTPFI